MTRLAIALGSLGTVLFSVSLAAQAPAGQPPGAPAPGRGGPPPPAKNLQVLPKDWTVQQVLPVMQGIAAGLGVECGYCHVTQAAGAPANDFPADAKPTKNKARVMLRMVQTINATLGSQLGKPAAEVTQVECATCHRGVPIPKQLVNIVYDTTVQKDTTAALQQFNELRGKFYGAQAYDFSDATLFRAAQRLVAAGKPDDAIVLARANIQSNPRSARSYQVIAQAYNAKKDTDNAIKNMELAVALDSENPQFKNQLNQLKNPQAGRGGPGPGAGPGGPAPGRGQ